MNDHDDDTDDDDDGHRKAAKKESISTYNLLENCHPENSLFPPPPQSCRVS